MTLEEMQRHIDELADAVGCDVTQRDGMPGMMYVEYEPPLIEGPLIKEQKDYFVMLHELGHVAHGHTQGRPGYEDKTFYFDNGVLRSEAEAWNWALDNAEEEADLATRAFMWTVCLGSYYYSMKAWGWGRPGDRLGNGNRHHVAFAPDKPDGYFWATVRRIKGKKKVYAWET